MIYKAQFILQKSGYKNGVLKVSASSLMTVKSQLPK